MELESEDGSEVVIEAGSKRVIGRESGFCSDDRTVSRRHLSLEIRNTDGETCMVSFEVLGQNPIWVFSRSGGDKRVFRKSSTGVMRVGDRVSLSLKKPIFFTLRKVGFEGVEEEEKRVSEAVERREKRTLEKREKEKQRAESIGFDNAGGDEELGRGSFDVSQIDPVKEFGFLVMGQEFHHYSKRKIHNAKDWNWFLEGPRENSEDEEVDLKEESKGNKRERRKKKGEGSGDEDWTGESEDEKVFIKKLKSFKRPNYSMTRSTDAKKPSKYTVGSKKSTPPKIIRADKDEDDDDTLGGFIVNGDDPEEEEEEEEEEAEEDDEEEEYDNDDDDTQEDNED